MKNVHIYQVFDLWQSYQEIKFRFIPIQTSSVPDYPDNFCIVTACNPRSQPLSVAQNRLRMEKLQRYLDGKEITYQKVLCGSPDFSWQEPSFAVSMPVGLCIDLARLYEQNAIYQITEGELWLMPTLIQGVERVSLGNLQDFVST